MELIYRTLHPWFEVWLEYSKLAVEIISKMRLWAPGDYLEYDRLMITNRRALYNTIEVVRTFQTTIFLGIGMKVIERNRYDLCWYSRIRKLDLMLLIGPLKK